jgi:hypothetical protein
MGTTIVTLPEDVSPSTAVYLAALRTRGIAVADIADADVNLIIDEALFEYSRYCPLVTDTTFSTVANTQVYTWDTMGDGSGQILLACLWNPYSTGNEWDLARTLATLGVPSESGYWHLPSQAMLDQMKEAAWAANYEGSGSRQHQTIPEIRYTFSTPNGIHLLRLSSLRIGIYS